MTTTASLTIEIDTSHIKEATEALDQLRIAAERASDALNKLRGGDFDERVIAAVQAVKQRRVL